MTAPHLRAVTHRCKRTVNPTFLLRSLDLKDWILIKVQMVLRMQMENRDISILEAPRYM